jgi:hypothetical protein
MLHHRHGGLRWARALVLVIAVVALASTFAAPPGARARSSDLSPRFGPGNEVSMGSRESGLFFEYTIEGADCGERQGDGSVTCTLTSDRVTASGTLYVSLGEGLYTRPSAEAKLGGSSGTPEENAVAWPPDDLRDAEGYVGGPFEHEESFDFAYDVQPGDAYVALSVWVGKVNGASDGFGVGAWMYPPAATPTVSPGCSSVLLSYSPDPPRAGDDVYLNAGVSATVSNAPDFYDRWEVDGSPLSGSVIEEWSGCAEAVKYVFFCDGAERFETMILPGGDCLEGVGWRGVVGAAGLAAAAAAAAVGLRRARKGRKSKGPEEYILQLSVDEVRIAAGQSAPVTATVWQVTPQGGYVPAPQASLRLAVSPTPAGLRALPASGMGTLTFQVAADASCPGGTGSVQVQGRAGGTYYRSTVTVEVGGRYSVEVALQDPQRVVPPAPGEVWAYARVTATAPVPQAELDKLTGALRFSVVGPNAGAVEMRDEQLSGGWKAVRLFQAPARVSGAGSPALAAQGMAAGSPLRGQVELVLKRQAELAFTPAELTLKAGRPAELVIALLEVRSPAPAEPVAGARISVQPPGQDCGLAIAPLEGPGPLKVRLLLPKLPEEEETIYLAVRGEAAGLEPVTASYAVEIAMEYGVEMRRPEDVAKRGTHARAQLGLPPEGGVTAHAVALDLSEEPAAPDDLMSRQIGIAMRGANQKLVTVGAETFAGGAQTAELRFVWPGEGEAMEEGDPELVAQLKVGSRSVEGSARVSLDECRLAVLKKDMAGVAARLAEQGWYVRNPLLGGATGPVLDKGYQAWSVVWDWTAGWVAQRGRGRRCEEFVAETQADVLRAVRRVYGDRARLETMVVIEQSTVQPRSGWWDSTVDTLDGLYDINHILFKLTAPNRAEYSIDFWEHMRYPSVRPPIVEAWGTTVGTWLRRMAGDINVSAPFSSHQVLQAGTVPGVR